MKVLLIEDDKILSDTIKQCICKIYDVSQEYDGYAGYMMAKEGIYDIIILDLMLPEMTGYDVLKKLRDDRINTPVLILTAKDSLQDKLKGFNYGADDYLVKPFEREELIARLAAIIRRTTNNYTENVLEFKNMKLYLRSRKLVIDGEEKTLDNLLNTLILGTVVLITISIVASYILSKRMMTPIYKSHKKQTEFVENASHELRTPLTIIQAKQELLLQEPESKIIDKSEDINLTLKETRRLSKMIKELMDLARSDSNKYVLDKEKIDIDKLVEEVAKPYKEYAELENKKMELNLNYNKEINIDKNKISELMIILLDNAIKYTEENDTITISTYSKDGKCNIEVADTGIGISDEGLKRVFDRFYREDKARNRETGGTGLGLSIAHTIVTRHKGSIKAMHNSPKGTVFLVRI